MEKPIVTVSILISNHYENVKRCLDSLTHLLQTVPSELILTDTGCGEEVRGLIEQYSDHIIDFTWCQDFSAARNVGLKEAKGEWFLYVDDDEWFEDTEDIETFLMSEESKLYNVAFYTQRNYTNEAGTSYLDSHVDRMIRMAEELHFEHRVHEAYTGIEIGEKKLLNSFVHHFGYVYKNEEEKKKKYLRNQKLLELECKEHPEDMRMHYQLVSNSLTLEDWDETIKLARKAIEIETNSEYWDACHTIILYCLKMREDWNGIITEGKNFIKKKLYPYDSFGVLQYMITASWHLNNMQNVYYLGQEAISLYNMYQKDPSIFNVGQLGRQEFLTEEKIKKMYEYYENANALINGEVEREEEFSPVESSKIVFEKDYFKGELIDGFYVEPMMKSAWAAQLEVLHKVDLLCQQYDIPYFADWGTLLGAVRHQGFIPWDDDMDICMKRADLDRFREVIRECQDELELLDIYTDPTWGQHAVKVLNTTNFTVNRKDIKEYHGFPFTAGIDIFDLDYVPRDKKLEEEQYDVLRTISQVYHLREEMQEYAPMSPQFLQGIKSEIEFLDKIKKMCHIEFSQEKPTDQELLILEQEVMQIYKEDEADYLTEAPCLGQGRDYYIPKDYYEHTIRLPFENTTIPVPVEYDFILRKKYGDNYMTPVNCKAGHDYPFYGRLVTALAGKRNDGGVAQTREYVENISIKYYDEFLHMSAEPTIEYEDGYFQEETINGCVVSEERKRIWAAQTEVMEEVKRICQKLDVKLFVIGSSLEEAVKYKDYGPESEDLHLGMLRKDYVTFMNHMQEELHPWFDYSTVYTKNYHTDMRSYIITDGYLCDEEAYFKRFHGCPHIVGVDIAPLDYVDSDSQRDEVRKSLVEGLLTTAQSVSTEPPYSESELAIVEEWKNAIQVDIDIEKNLQKEFVRAADSVGGAYQDECTAIRITADMQEGKDTIFEREWFDDVIELPFGQTTIPAPIGYEKIVRKK